jgi:hypothetical protein
MAGELPRVLIACPTAKLKDYCFDAWLENVMSFTYPLFDIVMYDNTNDGGKYAKQLNRRFKTQYGYAVGRQPTFKCYNSLLLNKVNKKLTTIERMALSHEHCRKKAIEEGYDYLLHLESDVFPPSTVIERLLFHGKEVVSALYYSDEGLYRRPVIQMHLEMAHDAGSVYWLSPAQENTHLVGGLLKVALSGLGCSLINKTVFQKIPFRCEKGVDLHPDTLFAEDCEQHGFDRYVDTSIVCKHQNRSWGLFGINYN